MKIVADHDPGLYWESAMCATDISVGQPVSLLARKVEAVARRV